MRRNFIIVDDKKRYAGKLGEAISECYRSKGVYDYNILPFVQSTHFADAKEHIIKRNSHIDVIFSDQKLMGGGSGTELFAEATREYPSFYESISIQSHIFRVLHSHQYKRHSELQIEQMGQNRLYEFFVNSFLDTKENVENFYNFYEQNIVATRQNGNKVYRHYLYNKSLEGKLDRESVNFDEQSISLSSILFFIMDKTDIKGESYFAFYSDRDGIRSSERSKKVTLSKKYHEPQSISFAKQLEELEWIEANLKGEFGEKIKVNPLWVSAIDKGEALIQMFSPHSQRITIHFDKITFEEKVIDKDIDVFFTKRM